MGEANQLLALARRVRPGPGRLVFGEGSAAGLASYCGFGPVLLVASERARGSIVLDGSLLPRLRLFTDVKPNPTAADAANLAKLLRHEQVETIVALGGGSAVDLAKAARFVRFELDPAEWTGAGLHDAPAARLVAVPTTAGTGSEMTPFATLYHHGTKMSVDDRRLAPDVALVDPDLARTCPPAVSVSAALDALAHAIESAWSRRADAAARSYALRVAVLLSAAAATALLAGVPMPTPDLMLGACLAGAAIAGTRTTAAHGFSYHLTSRWGVPHGTACAYNLRWVTAYNRARALEAPDPDGLRRLLDDLSQGAASPLSILDRLFTAAVRELPSPPPALEDQALLDFVRAGAGAHGRTDNNPVPIAAPVVLELLRTRDWWQP